MSRAVVLFCFALFAGFVTGNLIRVDDVTTKEVKIQPDDVIPRIDDVTTKEDPTKPFVVEKNDVETASPSEVFGTDSPKKCAEIGQFCTFHGECCTNACLGYLKRCVSGSG